MKVLVLGAGRMGSWFVKKLSEDNEVAVYDIERERVHSLKDCEKILSLEEITTFDPEIILNAVTLSNTVCAFEMVKPYVSEGTIFSDITSVKGVLKDYYEKTGRRFVSIHPMFGPTFANMESLKDENVIFVRGSDQEGVRFFKNFFMRFGLIFFELSFEEHDRMMAYALSVPFIATLLFASCIEETSVPGTTFSRHLSIARGLLSEDDHLIGEILFNNHTLCRLREIGERLEHLSRIVQIKDYEALKNFLNELRENLLWKD